ncbi:MAG: hypothetical protein AAF585_27445, partial [Verrucomicrobiota bacterium]
ATTAGGRQLGKGKGVRGHLRLREEDLGQVLAEFQALRDKERKPTLPDPNEATPPKRPVPKPPASGLIIRGYCAYMKQDDEGKPQRAEQFYYKENPDAWTAETQSDMLWLAEEEWRSLLPNRSDDSEFEAPPEIQRRLFSTLGIDYMEGSVNALPVRESELTFKPIGENDGGIRALKIEGRAKMGMPLTDQSESKARSRGCEITVFGELRYDVKDWKIVAFNLVGLGEAWGNKMNYTKRAIRIEERPWRYGIACELVTGDSPADLVPPYNLLHYGGGMKYFADES